MNADIVIDARGRASTISRELRELDYEAPTDELVGVNLCYTSRLYRNTGTLPDWKFLIINSSAPYTSIGGLVEKVEGDRWIVTQFGYFGDQAAPDDAGFLERARSLPVPAIADFLQHAEPAGDFQTFGTKVCRMSRFENLDAFPERLLVMGDAVCSLNPIYGQGMTKAALEAEHLADCLAQQLGKSNSLDGFAQSFRKSLPNAGAEWAWKLTTGADLSYQKTTGKRQPGGAFMGWYIQRLFERSQKTIGARIRLFDVMMLINPPTHLFKPALIRYATGL